MTIEWGFGKSLTSGNRPRAAFLSFRVQAATPAVNAVRMVTTTISAMNVDRDESEVSRLEPAAGLEMTACQSSSGSSASLTSGSAKA